MKNASAPSSLGERKLSEGSEPAPKKQVKKTEIPKKKIKQQKLSSFFKNLYLKSSFLRKENFLPNYPPFGLGKVPRRVDS